MPGGDRPANPAAGISKAAGKVKVRLLRIDGPRIG
jgi:hypothetical protein